MRFPYKKIPILDPKRLILRGHVYRPIIPITVKVGEVSVNYEVMIDSGSDNNIFDIEIAELLGIVLDGRKRKIFSGVGGGSIETFKHRVELEIGGISYLCNVYFATDLPKSSFGILGQEGFFNKFRVRFIYSTKVVEIVPESALME